MYVFTLTYLSAINMYACVHTYMYMCACRVPFNTNTLAENAAAAASSLTALLLGCLLRLSNFFFAVLHAHKSRFVFNGLDLFSVCRFIYCTFVYYN